MNKRPMVLALSAVESPGLVIVATGEHSVWPNTIVNGAPSRCSSFWTSAAGTVEPPEQIALLLEMKWTRRLQLNACPLFHLGSAPIGAAFL